jgi:Uma2 family endonuclease
MNMIPFEKKLRLGPGLAGTLMTPEEFDSAEGWDEDSFCELIHGVLVVNPLPLESEASPNDELGYLLRSYRDHHPQGSALDDTLPERLVRTPTNRRRADRLIWAGLGRPPDPRADLPTIVVEFLSISRRDRERDYVEKVAEYMAAGIGEYWIIDRFRRTMTVIVNSPGGPQERVVGENELYRTPRLPGFELPLARLLAAADRYQ